MRIGRTIPLMFLFAGAVVFAQSGSSPRIIRAFVQGDSSRLADFVERCQHEFPNHGLRFQGVPFDGDFDYNIIITQESSLGGAAASVIVLG